MNENVLRVFRVLKDLDATHVSLVFVRQDAYLYSVPNSQLPAQPPPRVSASCQMKTLLQGQKPAHLRFQDRHLNSPSSASGALGAPCGADDGGAGAEAGTAAVMDVLGGAGTGRGTSEPASVEAVGA